MKTKQTVPASSQRNKNTTINTKDKSKQIKRKQFVREQKSQRGRVPSRRGGARSGDKGRPSHRPKNDSVEDKRKNNNNKISQRRKTTAVRSIVGGYRR